MVKVCGIDEAGRGPVMGPLVLCGIIIDEKNESKLVDLGVKDSKLLTPNTRERLFEQIKKAVLDYHIIQVQPDEVDAYVTGEELNLNRLEAQKTAEIINKLSPDKVIVDCPSTNREEYVNYLKRFIEKKDIKIIAEHKADVNYPVVSAASILAKVTRDREIEKIKDKIGIDIGSGYPSDPITQKFLKENWDKHHSLFRKSWSTYKKFTEKTKQKGLKDF